ncbi:MAG: hypothetical protein AAGI70_06415 [Pseudomonadota bacterium]
MDRDIREFFEDLQDEDLLSLCQFISALMPEEPQRRPTPTPSEGRACGD